MGFVSKSSNFSFYLNSAIILLLVGIGIIGLFSLQERMSAISDFLVWLSLTCVFAIALFGIGDEKSGIWTGFMRLAVLVTWLLFGLSPAICLIIAAVLAHFTIEQVRPTQNTEPATYLFYTANSGLTLLTTHLMYSLFVALLPELSTTVIAIILGTFVAYIHQHLTTQFRIQDLDAYIRLHAIPEILIIIMTVLLPRVYSSLHLWGFLGIIGFVIWQMWQQSHKIPESDLASTENHDLTVLNEFGANINSQTSLSHSIDAIYKELDRLLNASTIYISLYDADTNVVDYPLVVQDGTKTNWKKHTLDKSLISHVIRTKNPILITHQDLVSNFASTIDTSELNEMQYMLTPLVVTDKVLGVLGACHHTNASAFSHQDFQLLQAISSQASLSVRNSILYERTSYLANNLATINRSLQDVMFNLDRIEALQTACRIAKDVLQADKAAIYLLQPELNNSMIRHESIGFEGIDFSDTISYEPSLFQNGARIFNNIDESTAAAIIEQAKAGQFAACVQIPLRSGNTIIGLLVVYHNEPYYYKTPEINLLEMLANQITAALDNADLLQALELYAAEQAQLVHLSRISSSSLDIEQIIYDLCELLLQMMNVSRIAIGLWQPERDALLVKSPHEIGYGLHTEELFVADIPELKQLLSHDGLSSLSLFNRPDSYSLGLQLYMQKHQDATLALLPMRVNQEPLGLIVLGHNEYKQFNDNEYRLLEMASNQITVQIHNARVHQLTEEQLVQGLEQLGLIEEISQQISQALDLKNIIKNVLEVAIQATQADFGSIVLVHPHHKDTYDVVIHEVVDEQLETHELQMQIHDGVNANVIRSADILLVPDNENFALYMPPPGAKSTFKSSLAVPLQTGDRILGALNLESTEKDFFTLEQASFVRSIAGHAGVSLDNANLLKEREKQINTLTLLRELSLEALSVINPKDVMKAVLRTALILLDADEVMLYSYNANEDRVLALDGLRPQNGGVAHFEPYLDDALLHKVTNSRELKFISDINEYLGIQLDDDMTLPRLYSLIVVPIIRRQQVHEILCIGFNSSYILSDEDLNTVDLLGVQLAGHLENASLNAAIKTSNDRMRAILDSTRDGIILLDSQGYIQDANSAAVELTQLPLQQNLYQSLDDIVATHANKTDSQAWQDIIEMYRQDPDKIQEEEFAFERDEEAIQLKLFTTSVKDDKQKIVGRLLILRDITQEKELQDFHDTMQSMVLHDIRGPLSSIITSMYVAQNIIAFNEEGTVDEALKQTVDVSLESANDLMRMVDTLRDLPMMTQMRVEPEFVSAYELAEKSYHSLLSNLNEANIAIELEIDKEQLIYVDDSLIRRVFVNLLHNAFKFTPENGKILICIDDVTEQENYVRVQIADTGPGIPESQRERIFGQFVQIEGRKPRAGGKGMGLGLSFCKLAVEAHGGNIWVEANGPLSGASFAFTLPISD